ncbi:MAG: hypothetical protein O9282_02615 [Flavobacterium sp.]|jgi:hypothetical protein|uniref:hypothetical protein n=1 Tax=Flavobacterium sp. TaxID=239 RepID=UPI0022C702B1|nr:hypothetical protein [Flavobacterium sp.]MCZ8090555.1 hypothetical protein [Flavobacterium sp.]MCZ8330187.1 hypothetical protein [Flavobacterium sp.]
MSNNKIPSLNNTCYSNYNAIEDYNVIENLFNLIYLGDRNEVGYSGVSNFLPTYVSNLSKTNDGYNHIQSELIRIKEKFENNDVNNRLFYINTLLDDTKKSYINSISKPLTFKDSISKAEEILSL